MTRRYSEYEGTILRIATLRSQGKHQLADTIAAQDKSHNHMKWPGLRQNDPWNGIHTEPFNRITQEAANKRERKCLKRLRDEKRRLAGRARRAS